MTMDEFADVTGIEDPNAFEVFAEELAARKTLASQTADLADGLRRIGIEEDGVLQAVTLLARERGQ
ncbi:hypothetical protein [Nocardia sp. CC227C]|uniref:hypothetical protein n=1 Tax=Nocardia sp. CC227C TaxID=3044562 RepID=UPI00278BF2B3|nr:hypothetical protein [Nocardia sp. CC227C]